MGNSSAALGYQTWHLNFQDRLKKETFRRLTPHILEQMDTSKMENVPPSLSHKMSVKRPSRSKSLPQVGGFPTERYPIGGHNNLNNNSTVLRYTLGPQSWDGSAGINSIHRDTLGRPRDSHGRPAV